MTRVDTPLLRPMRPDSLLRHSVPQREPVLQTPDAQLGTWAEAHAPGQYAVPGAHVVPPVLHAMPPMRRDVPQDAPPQHAVAYVQEDISAPQAVQTLMEDEDWADDSEDAVPTADMPVPVCVPLNESIDSAAKHYGGWWIGVSIALLAVVGYALWRALPEGLIG